MEYQCIRFSLDAGIARLTFNRPDKLNSFNTAMHAEIRAALRRVQDEGARVLVITGAGRGFCAGQDLGDPAMSGKVDVGAIIERFYRPLATRVRTILRRAGGGLGRDPASSASAAPQVAAASSTAGRIQVDEQRRQISYRGCVLVLTRHEYLLLQALVRQPGRVLGRDELLEIVGVAADAGYERNVDGHIRALRAKLRDIAPDASPIQTHRGFGYSYDPEQT